MSSPRAMAEMVVMGIRVFGKAMTAASKQAVANARYKPDAAPVSRGAGASGNRLTSDLQMSLDEARLILNVKKDDPIDVVQKHYDYIFKANSPPPPPAAADATAAAAPRAQAQAQARAKAKAKGPSHSHYLQSKVYRALERIRAEQAPAAEAAEGAAGAAGAAGEGAAAGSGAAGGAGPASGSGPSA